MVSEHREHFLKRKLTKHSLLNFTPSSYRIDATVLFQGITADIATPSKEGVGITTPKGLIQGLLNERGEVKIINANPSIIIKTKKIKVEANDAFHSTGQISLKNLELESNLDAISNALNETLDGMAISYKQIKSRLNTLGFVVKPQIGESGFRIDLGIKCNLYDLNFLCGIECDGARWHSGWTARTRDVWRQEILESKGWTILRVWSTTWFEKPEIARAELANSLSNLKLLNNSLI